MSLLTRAQLEALQQRGADQRGALDMGPVLQVQVVETALALQNGLDIANALLAEAQVRR